MIKTVFAGKPIAATIRPVAKAVRGGSVKAAINGAQVSIKTPFVCNYQLSTISISGEDGWVLKRSDCTHQSFFNLFIHLHHQR
jgi:hypothetical protein